MADSKQADTTSYQKTTVVVGKWWVKVVAPIRCDYFGMRNAGTGNVLIRTTDAPKTEYSVLCPGVQDSVTVPFQGKGTRFVTGDVVFYVRSADRTRQTVVVTWVR